MDYLLNFKKVGDLAARVKYVPSKLLEVCLSIIMFCHPTCITGVTLWCTHVTVDCPSVEGLFTSYLFVVQYDVMLGTSELIYLCSGTAV